MKHHHRTRELAPEQLVAAVDVALPLVVFVALTAFGLSAYLALAAGGILVAAKVALGRLGTPRSGAYTVFVASTTALAVAALCLLTAAGAPESSQPPPAAPSLSSRSSYRY